MKYGSLLTLLLFGNNLLLQANDTLTVSARHNTDDSISSDQLKSNKHKIEQIAAQTNIGIRKYGTILSRFIRAFDEYDTDYITPNYYNYAFMLQNTTDFEFYKLDSGESNKSITFAPNPSFKVGPYFGWRWIFLGWTFSPSDFSGQKPKKTEIKMSLYSSMLGCDLLYRRTGSDFRINRVKGFTEPCIEYEGSDFSGMRVSLTGFNAYYIFNHTRFSYPAAYSQSTVQRKSCGSWIGGFSFTRHDISFDHQELPLIIQQEMHQDMKFNEVKYDDYSLSVGYSYNWVFRKNCLFNISISPALGYKKTLGNMEKEATEEATELISKFSLDKFNLNCIGRAGIVWNNTKFHGGASVIVYSYNYFKDRFSMSNTFGAVNLYLGLNFMRKSQYRHLDLPKWEF